MKRCVAEKTSEQTQYDQAYLNIYSQTKDNLQTRNEQSEQLTHLR